MPEGDTIGYAANRLRGALLGKVPEEIVAPQARHAADRWPERLAGRCIEAIDTHGKNIFIHFERGLAFHSHLRMNGAWDVYPRGASWRKPAGYAWLVIKTDEHEAVQFRGPQLELITDARRNLDQRLRTLGPDILAEEFDQQRFLTLLRADDPTRGIGDALMDQRTIAGIGNIWKSEGCFDAGVSPWRPTSDISDEGVLAIVMAARPRMQRCARLGHRERNERVYLRTGRPCLRCGSRIKARKQGDDARTTYWCPGCQE